MSDPRFKRVAGRARQRGGRKTSDRTGPFCCFCKRQGVPGHDTPAGFVCRTCVDEDRPKWKYSRIVLEAVKADLTNRAWEGIAYHGGGLREGEDYLVRAYQEGLDSLLYLKAELMRRG